MLPGVTEMLYHMFLQHQAEEENIGDNMKLSPTVAHIDFVPPKPMLSVSHLCSSAIIVSEN